MNFQGETEVGEDETRTEITSRQDGGKVPIEGVIQELGQKGQRETSSDTTNQSSE